MYNVTVIYRLKGETTNRHFGPFQSSNMGDEDFTKSIVAHEINKPFDEFEIIDVQSISDDSNTVADKL